jgi:hypothetical protein
MNFYKGDTNWGSETPTHGAGFNICTFAVTPIAYNTVLTYAKSAAKPNGPPGHLI